MQALATVSNVDVCNWAYEGSLDAIRAALAGNPNLVNASDSNKRTPLHWACSSGKTDVVELLVSRKAQVMTGMVVKYNTYLSYIHTSPG